MMHFIENDECPMSRICRVGEKHVRHREQGLIGDNSPHPVISDWLYRPPIAGSPEWQRRRSRGRDRCSPEPTIGDAECRSYHEDARDCSGLEQVMSNYKPEMRLPGTGACLD